MKGLPFADSQLAQDTQCFYLKVACFNLRIEFSPSDQVEFKKHFLSDFVYFWGNLIEKPVAQVDFTIFVDFRIEKVTSISKENDYYILGWKMDSKKRKLTLSALQSVWVLQMALKHIVLLLIRDKGFVIHASSVMDENSCLHMFSTHSGGGKSTTSDWLVQNGMKKMTDDTVVVVKKGEGWECYGMGMVEKTHLPILFKTSKYCFYGITKSNKLEKVVPKPFTQRLKLVMRQVRTLDESMDESTYRMVVEFVQSSKVYNLKLPLRPNNILEVINEN